MTDRPQQEHPDAPRAPFRALSDEQAALFELNPNPVLVLDGQFRIRYVNAASAQVGGVARESLIGEHVWTRYPELRHSIFAQAYEAVLRDGQPTSFEERDLALERWRAVYAYPAEGGVIAILEDVTDRRRSERALLASEQALARAQAIAAIGSWSYSARDGVRLSAEAYRLLGLDPTSTHANADAIRLRLQPAYRERLTQALANTAVGDDVRMTVQFSRFDEKDIFLDVLLRVERREGGFASQVYGTVQDVSERIRANEALRRSEKMLRLAQEAANIGSFDQDLRTEEITLSEQLWRILGIDPAQSVPTLTDTEVALALVFPEDRETVRAMMQQATRSGEKQTLRTRIVRADGAVRHVLASMMLVRDGAGEAARLVGTVVDISEQVEAEAQRWRLEGQIQQAQKLESLGVLAGGIAHDFNNLLVGILGNASLALLELGPTHDAHVSIMEIERAAQRAAELTRQLLAYAGKGRFVVEPVDASLVVHEMYALLRSAISRNASIQLDLAERLPTIEVDATQFRQVVMNLITNASDALGEQGGLVTLRTSTREMDAAFLERCVAGTTATPGSFVVVEVTDTGAGMDAETVKRIFDPFFTTKFTGRGLGLAATLGIVRSHAGAIRVESAVGRGTSFCLLFPVARREREEQTPFVDARWSAHEHVLVVDDDESVRAVTSALLLRRGFRVSEAPDGETALAMFRAAPAEYALVVLDLTMPGMDGDATFRALHSVRPDVRVLLTSGYHETEVTQLFAGRGLAGFLQKPFRADDLYTKVAATLGIRPKSA
jgi:PAS domain S-box-containing protein